MSDSTEPTPKTTSTNTKGAHRRRGQALENDILAATLNLLQETKYEDITMDMIAHHAHTNKSVLYRRWQSKADIVIAALRTRASKYFNQFKQVPDTGSLEGDFRALFTSIDSTLVNIHYENFLGLMRERLGGISVREFFDTIAQKNFLSQTVRVFFTHAAARGEIDLTQFDTGLYDLPMLVLMNALYGDNDVKVSQAQFDHVLNDILMPVYRPLLKQ